MNMTGDAELLRRYANEASEEAFAELVRRHLSLVYFAALRQLGGNSHQAQEVAQLVFTDVARKAVALSRHPALASWLHTSTRYAAANARRNAWRRQKIEKEAQTMHALLQESPPARGWEQLSPLIDEVVHELKESDREVVLQRFFEGRAFAEIGHAFNLSEDAARMRVDRALDKLRALLAKRGVTSTAAALGAALAVPSASAAPSGLAAAITGYALANLAGQGGIAVAASAAPVGLGIKVAIGAAVAVAVVSAGLVFHQANTARATTVALLAQRLQTQRVERQLRDTENRRIVAEGRVTDPLTTPATRAAAPVSTMEAQRLSELVQQRLHIDPELQRLNLEQYRARLPQRFGPLYRALALSPEEIDQFETLLTLRSQISLNLAAARFARGLSETDPEFVALRAEVQREQREPLHHTLRLLLGEAGYEEFLRYEKTNPVRPLVDALATSIYHTEAPLTPAQATQLTSLLAEIRGPGDSGRADWTDLDWQQVTARAAGVLSAAQLDALQALRAQAARQQQIDQRKETIINAVVAPPFSSSAPSRP
jgi:RNA polymerase sigma factor (sigma-70 family)